jgi:hypothetical protein
MASHSNQPEATGFSLDQNRCSLEAVVEMTDKMNRGWKPLLRFIIAAFRIIRE